MRLFKLLSVATVLLIALPAHALIQAPTVTTSGVAPFGDTFDTYSLGDLTGQGLWQGDAKAWRVTDQGCYSGKCITTNTYSAVSGAQVVKTGQELSSGEWRIRFKINSFNFAPFSGTFISFGTADSHDVFALSIMPDKADPTFSTSLITDTFGNSIRDTLTIGAWHTLVFKWNMDDLANCQFAVTVDGIGDIFTNPIGNASDCYAQTFPKHVISTLELAHAASPNEVVIDDLGDGPIQEGNNACTPGTPGCNSNVMFLPGIESSELFASGSLTENKIWLPDSLSNQDVPSLDLTNQAATNNVYTKEKDILDTAYLLYPVYSSFINQMNAMATGTTPQIAAWEPIAYDWRLDYNELLAKGNVVNGKIYYRGTSAATSTPYIIQELKRLAESSRTKKVTIIAHSNGGLLAKALLSNPEYVQYVDKLIMVATPQLGTPKAIAGLLHGADQALPKDKLQTFLNNADARYLSANAPIAYNLLPSQLYLDNSLTPVVTIDSSTLPSWVEKYGSRITTLTQLRAFLTDQSRGKPAYSDVATPGIASTTLFDTASNTHNQLDKWKLPSGIKLITIAGWGNSTLASINYEQLPWYRCDFLNTPLAILSPTHCSLSTRISYTPNMVIDGDGTVIDESAQWVNGATSTNYWINLSTQKSTHANIFEAPQLRSLLGDLFTNSPLTSSQLISTTRPAYTGTDPRLYFVLHSPLTLGFKDSQGNYTGSTATANVFNSPGVDYERVGEVQWLSVPKSVAGQVVMHGNSSGSFSLDIQNVNGDSVLATTSFVGVPNATSTIATLNIDPSGSPTASSTLKVDFNGDGVVDKIIQSKEGSVVAPDFTAPEVVITFSTTTKDIFVLGMDDVSPVTSVVKNATSTTVTDQAGNTTSLYFQKTFTNNLLTYTRLTGISYGTTTAPLSASFLYVWDTSKTLVSQTVLVDNTFAIQALYNKNQNKTTILVLKKNVPIQTTTANGLAIIKLTTNKGAIHYSW